METSQWFQTEEMSFENVNRRRT